MKKDLERILHLEANEAGVGVLRYEPQLATTAKAGDLYGYLHAEDGYTRAVAEFCDVPLETVTPIGSALQQLDQVAHFSGATEIVVLDSDFRGYDLVARRQGLPLVKVPASSGSDTAIYQRLADTVRMLRNPLIFLTIGTTNPLQTYTDAARAAAAIQSANVRALLVFDTAYIDYCGIDHRDVARLASQMPRTVVINPCSKSHFIAGGAVGWMITGDPVLNQFSRIDDFPFRAPGGGCRMMTRLLAMPYCTTRVRKHVVEARDMNLNTLRRFASNDDIICGHGPWLLWNAKDAASQVVQMLKENNVYVQRQSGTEGLSSDWIRISATVPDESEIFAGRLEKIMCCMC